MFQKLGKSSNLKTCFCYQLEKQAGSSNSKGRVEQITFQQSHQSQPMHEVT